MKGELAAGLHIYIRIPGDNNPPCTNTAVNEARTQEIQKKGKKAVTAELEQLHRRDTFMPVRTEDLSEIQNHESLALLILLKEKRYRSIKRCGVADGRKQQKKSNRRT